jgi:hypothetical protein
MGRFDRTSYALYSSLINTQIYLYWISNPQDGFTRPRDCFADVRRIF